MEKTSLKRSIYNRSKVSPFRRLLPRRITYLILFSLFFSISSAEVWFVDPAGSPDPNGSPEKPFVTIQDALNTAQSGDTIILNPGIYSGPGNYNLNPEGLCLTIRSTDPENFDIISETIIDPDRAGPAFIFQNFEDPNFLLSGFTIRNSSGKMDEETPHGSAVFCSNASPTIRFCVFENCQAEGWGGAFYGEYSHSVIEHCLFNGNKARSGGALGINLYSQIRISHCTIVGNQALFFGGGLVCDFDSVVYMDHSIVFFNQLSETEGQGRQISVRDSIYSTSYSCISAELDDFEIIGYGTVLYNQGVIHTNPNFVFYDPNLQAPSQQDLHLQSQYGRWDRQTGLWIQDAVTSPCIDAGDPNAPWTAEPWPNGKRINFGFYGGTPRASMNGNPADFDLNGIVDLADFSQLVELWLNDLASDYHDLNRDGRIDLLDLDLFSRQWLRQTKNRADFNQDQRVDLEDLISFSGAWLKEGPALVQDLSGDAIINGHDFALFSRQWLWKN